MFHLTHKQLLELKYWLTCDMDQERSRTNQLFAAFGLPMPFVDQTPKVTLEIGAGPHWGLLPFILSDLQFAVDPLFPAYEACGILEERGCIRRIDEAFEHWDTEQTFDAVLAMNVLDHGELGFHVLPKIWHMLNPGGRLYAHVNLRPPELLNLLHDHALTEEQLNRHLSYTGLVEEHREIMPQDFGGFPSPTLIGVWRNPE